MKTLCLFPLAVLLSTPAMADENEVAQLKAVIAEQQKHVEALERAVDSLRQVSEKQEAMIEKLTSLQPRFVPAAEVASTTTLAPIAPAAVLPVAPIPVARPSASVAVPLPQGPVSTAATKNPCEAPLGDQVPPYLRIGDVCIVPVAFMDLIPIWRDKNTGSSFVSAWGGIPLNNTVNGKLSEFRFTPQNSRLGFRVDGDWKGTHFMAYNEYDFLGTSGATNITINNGAFVPRLRLFWVDARKGRWEFLAGQSWSMLTPNRNGISALPSDLFYSQSIDVSYVAGLTWTRQPGMRVLFHPSSAWTLGFSAENPEQYGGGSLGGSGITLPAAYASLSGTQINTGNEVLAAPTVNPDFIAKIAFDPSARVHFEAGGIERTFRIVNPALTRHFSNEGAGLLFGFNVDVWKSVRVISTNFWSDGGGRYLTGQAPDFIVRANGSISPVKADGSVNGVEAVVRSTLLYAYWGGIFAERDTAIDANGSLIGFGYKGAPNTMNRAINEITFGFNQTMWRNPRYGAINLMGQYYWAQRSLWSVANGAPDAAHDNTIFLDVRYSLPGSMPNF